MLQIAPEIMKWILNLNYYAKLLDKFFKMIIQFNYYYKEEIKNPSHS